MRPKKTKISLTAKQLASLDLFIARKKAGAKDYADDATAPLVQIVGNAMDYNVVPAAVYVAANVGATDAATAAATQALGGNVSANEKAIRDHFNKIGRKIPLTVLIELRNIAMAKK